MDLTNLKVIRELLIEGSKKPSKNLGQHFLLSRKTVAKIIDSAKLTRNDIVLEIGPGLGVLTFELARQVKKVIAVEKDERLAKALQKNIKTQKHKNIDIINQDNIWYMSTIYMPTFRQASPAVYREKEA